MIFNQHYECMPRAELKNLQDERLKKMIAYVYERLPYYREKMDAAGIKPEDVKSLDDLPKLPYTVKQDLRDNYPYDTFAVPMDEIVRVHASSGTTGKFTVVGYTANDIDNWADLMARTLASAGASRNDIIQNAYGYGLFTGGLGMHYGAERLGATIIPISGGNTKRQITVMKDFGTTMVACTPSYALFLADTIEQQGLDPNKDLNIRYGIFGAEPWSEEMRQRLQDRLGIRASDVYGLSEIIGPGVGIECEEQKGLHIFEDFFLPEIIDPDTGEVLPEGEVGELVITTINKEGIPVIRYRTRDITSLNYEPCACGRTHVRMHRIMGRSDDMLIIRGVNVFPTQIESVLVQFTEVEPHYVLVVERINNLDTLEIWVEMSQSLFSDEVRKIEAVRNRITHDVQSLLGISAKIKLVEPRTIERSIGKAKRVIDNRNK